MLDKSDTEELFEPLVETDTKELDIDFSIDIDSEILTDSIVERESEVNTDLEVLPDWLSECDPGVDILVEPDGWIDTDPGPNDSSVAEPNIDLLTD